jgi:hypothetical protein
MVLPTHTNIVVDFFFTDVTDCLDPKEILSLYRDRHKKPIYRITQTGYKYVKFPGFSCFGAFIQIRLSQIRCTRRHNIRDRDVSLQQG